MRGLSVWKIVICSVYRHVYGRTLIKGVDLALTMP